MVSKAKDLLRQSMRSKRNRLTEEQRLLLSDLIEEKLFSRPKFKEAKVIAFYLHKGSEVYTDKMISDAINIGKEVLVPVTNDHIAFYRFTSLDDLKPGNYGIREPKKNIKPSSEPDLIVVPGLSFGLCMHRVGYGKGCYDNYLTKSASYRIGICYDFQVIHSLPKHEDDQKMNEIITEKRIIT